MTPNDETKYIDHTASVAEKWGRLAEAVRYALDIHAAQIRKGAMTPYIGHLIGVASLVIEYGGDEDQAVAGMLHDAIEDCGIEQEALIATNFGHRVTSIVRGCTDADIVPKPPWKARKEAYIAHLDDAGPDILLVSACDKLHNARAICSDLHAHGLKVFDRFKAGQAGTIWYYGALSDAFSRLIPGALSAELARTVSEMQRLGGSSPVDNAKDRR